LGLPALLGWLEYTHGDLSHVYDRFLSDPAPHVRPLTDMANKTIEKDPERFQIADQDIKDTIAQLNRLNNELENVEQNSDSGENQNSSDFDLDALRTRLERNEGNRNRAFRIGNEGEIDIGMGHVMSHPHHNNPTARSRRVFQSLFGNSVDFDRVLRGQDTLSQGQLNQLNDYEINEHLERARARFPQFDTYPQNAQFAILDAIYRGDMGPATARLINSGDYEEAVEEYLNHRGYQTAVQRGLSGIRRRMEDNQAGLRSLVQVRD